MASTEKRLPKSLVGKLIGWKKCRVHPWEAVPYTWTLQRYALVKLEIPARAKRRGTRYGKCRASEARVLAIELRQPSINSRLSPREWAGKACLVKRLKQAYSCGYHDPSWPRSTTRYRVGRKVRPRRAFDNSDVECASGIHFFLSRKRAMRY